MTTLELLSYWSWKLLHSLLIKQKDVFSKQKCWSFTLMVGTLVLILPSINYGQYSKLFSHFLFQVLASEFPQYSSYIKTGEDKYKLYGFCLASSQLLIPFPILGWIENHPTLPSVDYTVIPEPRPSRRTPSLLYLEMALKSQNTYVSPTQGPSFLHKNTLHY